MAYQLLPTNDKDLLFFKLEGAEAERYGQIGYLRADFGKSGREFYSTWFDVQPHLKTYAFQQEFDDVIDSLRNDGHSPLSASRMNLDMFCAKTPGKKINDRCDGYMVRTQDYSYYVRCLPLTGNYDLYCFAYDNRRLLSELGKRHELPKESEAC